MKKYLLIFMGVLSLFFFTDNVNALSFIATNGQEYTVDSEEKLLDYCYYNYYKGKTYKNLILAKDGTNYKCILVKYNTLFYNNSTIYDYTSSGSMMSYFYYTFKYNFEYLDGSSSKNTSAKNILYSSSNLYSTETFTDIAFNSNFKFDDIESRYGVLPTYTITYYVNNEIYQTIEVEEGNSHILIEYTTDKNYQFSGWQYDDNIDLTNITSDINIYGTTTYSRPNMNYSENIDSIIHELSVSIIGKNVPVEFDYVYTIMDFIILIMLVLCVLAPFILVIKLLSGRW